MDSALGAGEGKLTVAAIESPSSPRTQPRKRGRAGTASIAALLALPTFLALVFMVVLPLGVMAWYSLRGFGTNTVSFDNYRQILNSGVYRHLFIKTFITAAISTALCIVITWPAAWTMSRIKGRQRNVVLALVIVPYLTSYLLLIYSMYVLLGSGGPLMTVLHGVGLTGNGSTILYSQAATVIVYAYENIPVVFFVLYSASERIDSDLLVAAGSLGASAWSRFTSVIAPLTAPSLSISFILVFVPTCGSFVEPTILGGPNGTLVSNVIADQLSVTNNPYFGSTLSVALLVGIAAILIVIQLLGRLGWRLHLRAAAS